MQNLLPISISAQNITAESGKTYYLANQGGQPITVFNAQIENDQLLIFVDYASEPTLVVDNYQMAEFVRPQYSQVSGNGALLFTPSSELVSNEVKVAKEDHNDKTALWWTLGGLGLAGGLGAMLASGKKKRSHSSSSSVFNPDEPQPEPVPQPEPTPQPQPTPQPEPTPELTPKPDQTTDQSFIGTDSDDELIGNDANNFLKGGKGNDKLFGGKGDDILYGDEGNDILDGGEGADIMIGGQGRDIYRVDNEKDQVIEEDLTGTLDWSDVIYSTAPNFVIPPFVEQVYLKGSENWNIDNNRNNQSSIIRGNSGNNYFANLTDSSKHLTGGGGQDTFEFVAQPATPVPPEKRYFGGYSRGSSMIYDFGADDKIILHSDIYPNLSKESLIFKELPSSFSAQYELVARLYKNGGYSTYSILRMNLDGDFVPNLSQVEVI